MAPHFKSLLSLFLFTTFLGTTNGGYIPQRKLDEPQQNTLGKLIQVPQLPVKELGNIIASAHTIQQLLAEVQIIEKKLLSLLNQQAAVSSIPVVVETVIPLPALPSAVYTASNSPASINSAWTTTVSITTTTTVYESMLQNQPLTSNVVNEAVPTSIAIIVPPLPSPILGPPGPIPPNPISPPTYPSQILSLLPPSATSTISIPPVPQTLETSTNQAGKYHFDRRSSSNVAVYYGQTAATSTTPLTTLCSDSSIDIVVLAFVVSQLVGGKYPSVNFGSTCGGQTTKMSNEAPGLLWCPELAGQIKTCQEQYGKKVFLSVGGSTSQISFGGTDEAVAFADVLWGVFGPSGGLDPQLRPFGTVEVDGFDIDNEDNHPAHFDTLASTLRSHFSAASKDYYLSSAPQCPFPDASDPLPLILLCDFVWVQFYNNPSCEIGSANFQSSLQQWSSALQSSTLSTKPRLYLGAPAWSAAGPTAYAGIGGAQGMKGVVESVKGMDLKGFGGVMFWDGSEGLVNVGGGKDIISWAKEGLGS